MALADADVATIAAENRAQTAHLRAIAETLEKTRAPDDRYADHPLNSLDEELPLSRIAEALERIADALEKEVTTG